MDDEPLAEAIALARRLDAIEAKLDRVLVFTGKLEALLAAYLGSGAKGVLSAVLKAKGVGR